MPSGVALKSNSHTGNLFKRNLPSFPPPFAFSPPSVVCNFDSDVGLLKFSSEPRFEPEPGELNSGFGFDSGSVLPLSCRFWFWFGAPALSAELVLNWFEPEPDRV